MLDLLLQQAVNGITQGMAYALIALGLTMIFGVQHVINFAHGEFFMLGGLVAALATTVLGLPYVVGVGAALVIVALVAVLVDRLAVRPLLDTADGQSTVLLSTFAVSLLLYQGVLTAWGPNPERVEGLAGVLSLGPISVTYQRVLVLAAGVMLLGLIEWVIRRSLVGKRIRAVAQSAYAARVVGVDVASVRALTFLGAAALAGLTGALVAPISLFSPTMGQHVIINAFVVVVIGGMGSAIGAVVCGLALGILEAELSVVIPQEIGSAIIYALLLVALFVRPQGLFGKVAR
ncbi:MAG: branched-chain amino acid ABC transporter permease [Proteobacteria bacterium]|nr:branched-chain amino acid ABC transporter permease [Pseudomonadota bacterium]